MPNQNRRMTGINDLQFLMYSHNVLYFTSRKLCLFSSSFFTHIFYFFMPLHSRCSITTKVSVGCELKVSLVILLYTWPNFLLLKLCYFLGMCVCDEISCDHLLAFREFVFPFFLAKQDLNCYVRKQLRKGDVNL